MKGGAEMNEYIPKVNPEWKALCPPLSETTFSGLRTDIKMNGCREALLEDKKTGFLLDGHNRLQICEEEGIPFEVKVVDIGEMDPMLWIAKNQLNRRNLNAVQKVKMLLPVVPQLMEENEQHRREAISRSRRGVETSKNFYSSQTNLNAILAEAVGISSMQVAKIRKILTCGNDVLIDQVIREEVSVHQAYTKIRAAEKAATDVKEDSGKGESQQEEALETKETGEEAPEDEDTEDKVTEEEAPGEEEASEVEETEDEDSDEESEFVLKPRETPLPPPPQRKAGDIVPGFGMAQIVKDDMKDYVCPPDSVYDLPGISMGGFSEEQEVGQMDFQQIETKVNEVSGRFVMPMGTIVNKMNPEYYQAENIARLREILTAGYDKIMKMLDEKGGNGNE